MPKSPSYRKRTGSTQAIVTLTDSATGKRRDYWLGEFGTTASREAYHCLIAECETLGRRLPDRHRDPVALVNASAATVTDINQQARRNRQLFKWAVSQELVPPAVHHALCTVESLMRGRTAAKEGKTVAHLASELIDAVRPHLIRQVRALVDPQLLTGARSGALLRLRPIDIEVTDRSGVWIRRPMEHKNLHRGKARTLFLGPAAQRVIGPFLIGRPVDSYLFSRAEAESERLAPRHDARKTPMSGGNRPGTNRRSDPARSAGEHYTRQSYYKAVQLACDEAFPPPGTPPAPAP